MSIAQPIRVFDENVLNNTTDMEDYEIVDFANTHLKLLWNLSNIYPDVMIPIANFFIKNGEMPSKTQCIDTWIPSACYCVNNLEDNKKRTLLEHFIPSHGRFPVCSETNLLNIFYQDNSRWPDQEEFKNLVRVYTRDNEAKSSSTKNLDKLTEQINDKENITCSICQEDIQINQKIYILPCKHTFHATKEECLDGESNILAWLTKHDTCPTCKTKIKLE
jgi:hypothetical protein